MPDRYQSYVVRVRHRGSAADSVRIDVEDLLGGGRAQLSGGAARALATGLAAAIAGQVEPTSPEATDAAVKDRGGTAR
jgi:hypothetical protein